MGHTIRLRAPWKRVNAPNDGEAADTPLRPVEQACFSRAFHRPTGLAPDQTVQLIIQLASGIQLEAAHLNAHRLSLVDSDARTQFAPIGTILMPYNTLQLTFTTETGHTDLPTAITEAKPFDCFANVELQLP